MDFNLQKLEQKGVYILRQARSRFKNIAVLFSMRKDSMVMLYLCRKAFFNRIPFSVIHIEDGHDSPETYQFRDKLIKDWNINLLIARTEFEKNFVSGTINSLSKVKALKKIMEKYKFGALVVPIKKGFRKSGQKEIYFSPRDKDFCRHKENQDFKEVSHFRVHPFLDWTELDIWKYIKEKNIPVSPLYFAKNRERDRNINYPEAILPAELNADTIDEVIRELKITQVSEKQDRVKDGRKEQTLQRLRELGYL